jgi:hypothetical protein
LFADLPKQYFIGPYQTSRDHGANHTYAGGLGKCFFKSPTHFLHTHTAVYNDSTHWEAMAAVFHHLNVTQLSSKETEAVLECGEFLNTAPFRAQDDYEVCTDNEGLGTSSQLFIDRFAPGAKVYTHR